MYPVKNVRKKTLEGLFMNRQGYQVKNLFRDGTPPIVLIVPYSDIEFSARV